MKAGIVIALMVGLALIPASAMATDRPGPPWDFQFTYADPTGGPTGIPDNSVRWYPLDLTFLAIPLGSPITYLELEIVGLTHTRPEDLNFFLLDPLGAGIEVMDDAGDGFSLADITLIYSDFTGKEIPLPHGAGEGPLAPGPGTVYLPDGPEAFTNYDGTPLDSASWILVVIDDSEGDSGSFQSVSLQGIPEPMTLSLLAVGALVALRRRRR